MPEGIQEGTKDIVKEPKSFKIPVKINGLDFNFEGQIPVKPEEESILMVKVLNWQEQADAIEKIIKERGRENVSWSLPIALNEFIENEGVVGWLRLTLNEDHLILNKVKTSSWILPPNHGYENARGIGSFLVANFCTLADSKQLPSVLEPYADGDSPLSDDVMVKWYRRNGFRSRWEFSREEEKKMPSKDYGSMIRMPQEPDLSRPIAAVFTKK